ncbi:hypothetical protein ACIRVF_11215 [Kitasatospora sp. NPDC101157]|uniref:hypothetical protein n=1 Tax=Kitasatospora sp. NPDC101157 TaxID=3364098 RepID=UPI00382406DE
MAKLPPDATLSKLYALGRTDRQIAEEYGVTVQAVNKRLTGMGLARRPVVNEVSALLKQVWTIQSHAGPGSHHDRSPAQSLKLWLRLKLRDQDMSERQRSTALAFERRLKREGAVLSYAPDEGWSFVPRVAADENLAIRWPSDRPRPEGSTLDVWRLNEDTANTPQ